MVGSLDTPKARDQVTIEDLEVVCIVGILPEERRVPQPLRVAVQATVDVSAAALGGDLDLSLDYAALARHLTFALSTARFRLLESAALALCHLLLVPAPGATRPAGARITLRKPKALGGRGVPSLTVERGSGEVGAVPGQRPGEIFRCHDALIEWLDASAPVKTPVPPQGFSTFVDETGVPGSRWVLRIWTNEA